MVLIKWPSFEAHCTGNGTFTDDGRFGNVKHSAYVKVRKSSSGTANAPPWPTPPACMSREQTRYKTVRGNADLFGAQLLVEDKDVANGLNGR